MASLEASIQGLVEATKNTNKKVEDAKKDADKATKECGANC